MIYTLLSLISIYTLQITTEISYVSISPSYMSVVVTLVVELPSDYPSVIPSISIEVEKGLSKKQADEVKALALSHAENNVGMAMIFTIVEAIKEWLTDNNSAGQDGSMYADMMRRMQQKDVAEKKKADKAAISAAADSEMKADQNDPEEQERIRKRQAGTQVTLETFIEWKIKFDAEMKAIADAGKKIVVEIDDRPTGKQYFSQNSTAIEDEAEALVEEGEQEDFLLEGEEEEGRNSKHISGGVDVEFENDEEDDDDEDYVDDGGDEEEEEEN